MWQMANNLNLTARRYGEVVLPDVIPADHLSWFFSRGFLSAGKGGYGALFAVIIYESLKFSQILRNFTVLHVVFVVN